MFPTLVSERDRQDISVGKPDSSHAQEPSESIQLSKQPNRELSLNMLIKEFIFCIALALTTYGALHNTSSKTSKYPQAVRFFSPSSFVVDWYRGQLIKALNVVNKEDVSFVMYYAPWDAESQYVRGEFEKAATVLINRVHFSAINCWHPGSECRLRHSKITSWPILVAYTSSSSLLMYKGPRDAHSMVKFLELIMKPLEKVSSMKDLVFLLSTCDAVAVAYTPVADTSKYYNVWYSVALKSKEFDTVGELCFGVLTSEALALNLGMETAPTARLLLWNGTVDYVPDNVTSFWEDQSLLMWTLSNFTQPVGRIIPTWRKAFSFDRYVDGNPLLVLFTPLNPLYRQLPAYDLLREVAMEYYSCKNSDRQLWIRELIKLQQIQRIAYQRADFANFCQNDPMKHHRKEGILKKHRVISQNNKYRFNNLTVKNKRNSLFDPIVKGELDISKLFESAGDNAKLMNTLGLFKECDSRNLPAEKSFYDDERCDLFYDDDGLNADMDDNDIETTMLPMKDDPLSAENLQKDFVNHFCRLTKFAKTFGAPILPVEVDVGNIHLHGVACARNFTLNMVAVDSVQNYHFAENLGVDITKKKDMTAVVILDSQHESQYVLSEDYNAKSIREFIHNFTFRTMERSFRTNVDGAANTHFYGSDKKSIQTDIPKDLIIIDLTTQTFRKIVQTPGMVTLVALCGGACSASVIRALLEASKLLKECGVRVRPARLDARRYDLPWHYTAHSYPTILVFNANGEGETDSQAYPLQARITSSGLVALALRSLGAPQHLRVRLALCNNTTTYNEKKTCLKDIKGHVAGVIDRNLKYWRRTDDPQLRESLLNRLQHLHRVYFEFGLLHLDDLQQKNAKERSLIESLEELVNNWKLNTSGLKRNSTEGKTKS